ncbi:MAG: HEAT repeat domain-containing protein [Armatimonadetes bacterium]|nr:HEAT repeat domain-containing protein [Armatimonadota bacterium]
MKKLSKFEIAYESLSRIGAGSGDISREAKAELTRSINGSNSLLTAKAAEIASNRNLHEMIPDMISAFERFMVDGARTDKQCNAKIAIAKALNEMELTGDAVFLSGAYYTQIEPAFGTSVDTAAELRCVCAYGLARIEHPDAHYILADILVDREARVRSAAAKALGYIGSPQAELLLRLKVLTGDSELDVVAECFAGLITMAPDRSLDFVARYLRSEDGSLSECAALAIGGSRNPKAYDTLRSFWDDDPSPLVRRRLLLPIALVRSNEALNFLTEIVRTSDIKTATKAVSALSLYVDDASVSSIRDAVMARGDADLLRAFEAEIGPKIQT